jgi:hypothetical protein
MLNVGLILFGCFCEQTFEQRACENYQARGTTVFFVEICSFRFTVTMHERNIFDTREKYEQEGHNTAFTKNQKKKFPLFYSIDQRKPA